MFDGVLRVVTEFSRWGGMWAMLWFVRGLMFKTCEELVYVPGHAYVDMAFKIVPLESYATI